MNRAICFQKLDQTWEALQDFQKAEKMESNNPSIKIKIGNYYYKIGDSIKAKQYFQQAQDLFQEEQYLIKSKFKLSKEKCLLDSIQRIIKILELFNAEITSSTKKEKINFKDLFIQSFSYRVVSVIEACNLISSNLINFQNEKLIQQIIERIISQLNQKTSKTSKILGSMPFLRPVLEITLKVLGFELDNGYLNSNSKTMIEEFSKLLKKVNQNSEIENEINFALSDQSSKLDDIGRSDNFKFKQQVEEISKAEKVSNSFPDSLYWQQGIEYSIIALKQIKNYCSEIISNKKSLREVINKAFNNEVPVPPSKSWLERCPCNCSIF